jgi:hypothetical protein
MEYCTIALENVSQMQVRIEEIDHKLEIMIASVMRCFTNKLNNSFTFKFCLTK